MCAAPPPAEARLCPPGRRGEAPRISTRPPPRQPAPPPSPFFLPVPCCPALPFSSASSLGPRPPAPARCPRVAVETAGPKGRLLPCPARPCGAMGEGSSWVLGSLLPHAPRRQESGRGDGSRHSTCGMLSELSLMGEGKGSSHMLLGFRFHTPFT